MRRVARQYAHHPKVRQLALNILQEKRIPSQNHLDEAKAIGEFVQDRVRYVRDIQGMEQLHDPLYMIEKIQNGAAQGDCDDMALLIATLLLSVGFSPNFTIVRYQSDSGPWNHIYVSVNESNWRGERKRLDIDAIIKDREIGYAVPFRTRKDIAV